MAIPRAFEGSGIIFGLGYLFVILFHAGLFAHAQQGAGLFAHAQQGAGLSAIFRIAPLNILWRLGR